MQPPQQSSPIQHAEDAILQASAAAARARATAAEPILPGVTPWEPGVQADDDAWDQDTWEAAPPPPRDDADDTEAAPPPPPPPGITMAAGGIPLESYHEYGPRVCVQFQHGHCSRGGRCWFSHIMMDKSQRS